MHRLTPAVAAACAAAALWLSRGILAVAGETPASSRLALLPPWWALLVLVLAAVLAARIARLRAAESLPLFLTALLVAPWLPAPLPAAAFTFTGAMAAPVWAAAILGLVASKASGPSRRWLMALTHVRGAAIAAGLVAFVLYAAAAWRLSPHLPDGDEPHYLVIAQSLLRDGDLRIENNHRQRDYLAYFDRPLEPDYLRRGADGAIYSVHAPGLPVAILPAFAAFGYRGVVIVLVAVAALTTALAWRAAYAVTARPSAAWFGWAAVALSAPFFLHAMTVFPDMPAAALVMVAVARVLRPPDRPRAWFGAGAALAALPWLHSRYAVIAVVMALLTIGPAVRTSRRSVLALAAVPLLSALAWLGYFAFLYGTPDPRAPYGGYTQVVAANAVVGLGGLLFDQTFGAVATAPVLAVACAGVWLLPRRHRLVLPAVFVPYALIAGSHRMWWAGWSGPARFLVPVLPLLAIPAAAVWVNASARVRLAAVASLALTILATGAHVIGAGGQLAFGERLRSATWLSWANPIVDLATAAPSFLSPSRFAGWGRVVVWAACLGAAWALVAFSERRLRMSRPGRVLVFTLVFAAGTGSAVAICWNIEGAHPFTPARSMLELARRYDETRRPLGYMYPPPRLVRAEEVLDSIPSLSWPNGDASRASPAPRRGDVHVVALGGMVFPESNGWCVGAASDIRLLVQRQAMDEAPRLTIVNVPVANRITVVAGKDRRDLELAPRASQTLDLNWRPGQRTLMLSLRARAGVRPADLDPHNTDRRLLGVWLQVDR